MRESTIQVAKSGILLFHSNAGRNGSNVCHINILITI
jgi:hypothetical protein